MSMATQLQVTEIFSVMLLHFHTISWTSIRLAPDRFAILLRAHAPEEVPSWYKVGQISNNGRSIKRVHISVPLSVLHHCKIVAYSYPRLTNIIWHVWRHSALDQRTLHDQTWRCRHSGLPVTYWASNLQKDCSWFHTGTSWGILCAMTLSLAMVWLDAFGHKDHQTPSRLKVLSVCTCPEQFTSKYHSRIKDK